MEKEFVGFVIENGKQKRASFFIDSQDEVLVYRKVGLFSGILGNVGLIGALASSSIDSLKKKDINTFDLSSITKVEFCKFGLTSKAIKITNGIEQIIIFPEKPKEILGILQSFIKS